MGFTIDAKSIRELYNLSSDKLKKQEIRKSYPAAFENPAMIGSWVKITKGDLWWTLPHLRDPLIGKIFKVTNVDGDKINFEGDQGVKWSYCNGHFMPATKVEIESYITDLVIASKLDVASSFCDLRGETVPNGVKLPITYKHHSDIAVDKEGNTVFSRGRLAKPIDSFVKISKLKAETLLKDFTGKHFLIEF